MKLPTQYPTPRVPEATSSAVSAASPASQSLTSPQHHTADIDALTALQVEEVIYTQSQGNTSYQLDSESSIAPNVQEPTLQQQHTAYEDRTVSVLPPYNLCIGNNKQPQPFEAEQHEHEQEQELARELEQEQQQQQQQQKQLGNTSYEQFLKLSAHEYSEPDRSTAAALNLSSIGEKEAALVVESKTDLEDPPEFRMLREVNATEAEDPRGPTAGGISNKGREP
ncbi:involucrin-like [Drosophila santomea]|uniref:involucrin-like n=1 Tax=Drosophila santomea TaxID=129105 RepID=UPI001CCE0A15|nr:involucrin-like [Drosophila santomea]